VLERNKKICVGIKFSHQDPLGTSRSIKNTQNSIMMGEKSGGALILFLKIKRLSPWLSNLRHFEIIKKEEFHRKLFWADCCCRFGAKND
jgi:hypothetical protein